MKRYKIPLQTMLVLLLMVAISTACSHDEAENEEARNLHFSVSLETSNRDNDEWTHGNPDNLVTMETRAREAAIAAGMQSLPITDSSGQVIGEAIPELYDELPRTAIAARTRATLANVMHPTMGVLAYSYTNNWNNAQRPNLMYNYQVGETNNWQTTEYWPGSGKVRFYAYAPYNASGVTLSSASTPGAPTLTYTTPTDGAKQQDLLVAKSGEVPGYSTGNPVPLKFKHILTGFAFKHMNEVTSTGTAGFYGYINSISASNVYRQGTYNMETESWSNLLNRSTFKYTNTTDHYVQAHNDRYLEQDQYFLVIPQYSTSSQTMVINYRTSSGGDYPIEINFPTEMWQMGKYIDFKVSIFNTTKRYTLLFPGYETNIARIPLSGGSYYLELISSCQCSRGTVTLAAVPHRWRLYQKSDALIVNPNTDEGLGSVSPNTDLFRFTVPSSDRPRTLTFTIEQEGNSQRQTFTLNQYGN